MWNKKILYFILIGIASLGVCAQPAVRQGYSIHFPDTYTKWQEALLAGELRAHDKQRGGVDVEGPDTVRCELRILTVEQVYKEGGEQKHDQPQENG